MAKNTITERFRQSATDDQWRELVEDHSSLSDDDFKSKYGFTWNAIMQDAADKGFYKKKNIHRSSTLPQRNADGSKLFYVADRPADRKKISRSVQIDEDIYARLQSLEHDKGQYTHSSILNQLLDDALKKYGY